MLSGHIQQNWHYLKIAIISWFWKKINFLKKFIFSENWTCMPNYIHFYECFGKKRKPEWVMDIFAMIEGSIVEGNGHFLATKVWFFVVCFMYYVICVPVAYLISSVHYIWPYSLQSRAVSNKHHVIPIQVLVVIDTAKYLAFQFPKILFPSLNLVCFCISLFLPLLPLCNNSRLMTSWTLMRGRKFLGAIQFLSRS